MLGRLLVSSARSMGQYALQTYVGTVAFPPARFTVRTRMERQLALVHAHGDADESGMTTNRTMHTFP